MRGGRGSILIVSLWILTVLALAAAALSHRARVESRLAAYARDEVRLVRTARNALAVTAAALRLQGRPPEGGPGRLGRPDEALYKGRPAGDGTFSLVRPGAEGPDFGPEDEAGRINVNKAPAEVLRRLFPEAPEVADAVAARLRDGPDAARRSRADFSRVEELLMVKGMTPALYARAAGLVTVHGGGAVNVHTAPLPVLEALGLGAAAGALLDFRRGADGLEGTEDDRFFSSAGDMAPALDRVPGFPHQAREALQQAVAARLLDVRPGPWRLGMRVSLEGSRASRGFEVVMDASGAPRVLSWREFP